MLRCACHRRSLTLHGLAGGAIASAHHPSAVADRRGNAPLPFGALLLAPLWGPFVDANPKVSLDITLRDRVIDVVDDGYDLAIRITRIPDSTLVTRTPIALGTVNLPRSVHVHAVLFFLWMVFFVVQTTDDPHHTRCFRITSRN
jgi:DNA-binding transcriptional LysR family regulator